MAKFIKKKQKKKQVTKIKMHLMPIYKPYQKSLQSFKLICTKLYEDLSTQSTYRLSSNALVEKGGITLHGEPRRKNGNKIWVRLVFMLILYIKFHDPGSNSS